MTEKKESTAPPAIPTTIIYSRPPASTALNTS
jgi:hypothetical protein